MQTKVTLVEWPRHPIETVYCLWEAARSNDPIDFWPEELSEKCKNLPVLRQKVRETFEKVVDSSIPIAENLQFVFLLEGVSISFREQMVRHKVGVKVGERLGVDMFPDIHDSTWWIQSTRALNMGRFYLDGMYRMPASIDKNIPAAEMYEGLMEKTAEVYNRLIELGIPGEDAREILPLATQHRLSWGINLSSLMHVCKKRSCWIMQLGVWEPIIKGMIEELSTKVDPYFRNIVTPPCIKGDKFKDCLYHLDNERRVERSDPLLPCPIYLYHHQPIKATDVSYLNEKDRKLFFSWMDDWSKFWGRDPHTGIRFNATK